MEKTSENIEKQDASKIHGEMLEVAESYLKLIAEAIKTGDETTTELNMHHLATDALERIAKLKGDER